MAYIEHEGWRERARAMGHYYLETAVRMELIEREGNDE